MTRLAFLFTVEFMNLILASQSPYRKVQLENFGLTFQTEPPRVDESALKLTGPKDLTALTRYLALQKAQSLRPLFKDAIILGSDQIVECAGERLDKPGGFDQALKQLLILQGREHTLITSLVVLGPQALCTFTDVTRIRLRALSQGDAAAYLRMDQPYDCAGSYKIEKAGLALVEHLQTLDPSAIQGLPLLSLTAGLLQLGFTLEDFWQK